MQLSDLLDGDQQWENDQDQEDSDNDSEPELDERSHRRLIATVQNAGKPPLKKFKRQQTEYYQVVEFLLTFETQINSNHTHYANTSPIPGIRIQFKSYK
jgi:hypothetical protein